jgi:hypothetical protein
MQSGSPVFNRFWLKPGQRSGQAVRGQAAIAACNFAHHHFDVMVLLAQDARG